MATSPAEIYGSLARSRRVILGQIDHLLLAAVATGESAVLTARKVAGYLSPWAAQRRKPTGGLVRQDRPRLVEVWPGKGGQASAHARMVMLTETTRVHSGAVVLAARVRGRMVRRRVGSGHVRNDECDGLAGIYEPGDLPRPPTHPNCRCYTELLSAEESARERGRL